MEKVSWSGRLCRMVLYTVLLCAARLAGQCFVGKRADILQTLNNCSSGSVKINLTTSYQCTPVIHPVCCMVLYFVAVGWRRAAGRCWRGECAWRWATQRDAGARSCHASEYGCHSSIAAYSCAVSLLFKTMLQCIQLPVRSCAGFAALLCCARSTPSSAGVVCCVLTSGNMRHAHRLPLVYLCLTPIAARGCGCLRDVGLCMPPCSTRFLRNDFDLLLYCSSSLASLTTKGNCVHCKKCAKLRMRKTVSGSSALPMVCPHAAPSPAYTCCASVDHPLL
jgi:hypothetical protein